MEPFLGPRTQRRRRRPLTDLHVVFSTVCELLDEEAERRTAGDSAGSSDDGAGDNDGGSGSKAGLYARVGQRFKDELHEVLLHQLDTSSEVTQLQRGLRKVC